MSSIVIVDEQHRHGQAPFHESGGLFWLGRALVCVFLVVSLGCRERASDPPPVALVELTDANFQEEVIEANQPVLVEFWAPWCEPCLAMAPAMEKVAQEFSGRATVARIRIDENSATASTYNVEAPPAVIVFRDGQVFKRRHGKQAAEELVALLAESLSDENGE